MELTTASVYSDNRQRPEITQQPHPVSRWWMRHHMHIGLASLAGSAILMCIVAVILLPIAVRKPSDDEEPCTTGIPQGPWSTPSTLKLNNTNRFNFSYAGTQKASFDLLCALNATWKINAITIAGSSNDSNLFSRANLNHPNDILLTTDGSLFIADSENHRIVYWPTNVTKGQIVIGTGTAGSWANLLKYAAAVVGAEAVFAEFPSFVAWNDQLYVSDLGNYRIMAFPLSTDEDAPDGVTIVGQYGAGSALDQINSVYYMYVDSTRGILYLSDFENHRVLNMNLTDYELQLVVGTGFNGSNNASLNLPLGITVDENTRALYVADSRNHRIQKFDFNSKEGLTVAGGRSYGSNLSQLYFPSGIAIDAFGNIYVADTGNHRIVQWLIGAEQGLLVAGTGISGNSNNQLNHPVQLKFDHYHNLYIVDRNNSRIQRFDLISNGC
ncbi:unnamed protein product [Adineta ricciae]|uniref:Uncharacterized protein n=1 Tax=Adineta ricciae TaxID=249248 RepID=A0A814V2Y5_ADIRI|nr:unnamed protein product [Adineta ricciae]